MREDSFGYRLIGIATFALSVVMLFALIKTIPLPLVIFVAVAEAAAIALVVGTVVRIILYVARKEYMDCKEPRS